MRRTLAALLALVACLLAGCTATVAGAGQVGLPASGSSGLPNPNPGPTAPGGPGGGTPATVTCPTVTDAGVGLSFRCVTSGIALSQDPVWPLNLTKKVESGWVLGEGAGSLGATAQVGLRQVTGFLRKEMVALQYWGTNPGVRTVADKSTKVDGVDAWLLQTTFTIDPAFRRANHLKVRTERTWILALRASDQRIAVWYVTLPDEVARLWPKVPALISTIKLI